MLFKWGFLLNFLRDWNGLNCQWAKDSKTEDERGPGCRLKRYYSWNASIQSRAKLILCLHFIEQETFLFMVIQIIVLFQQMLTEIWCLLCNTYDISLLSALQYTFYKVSQINGLLMLKNTDIRDIYIVSHNCVNKNNKHGLSAHTYLVPWESKQVLLKE